MKKKTTIKFGNIEIEKQKFDQHQRPISIKNIDINKIAVFIKVSFGKRGFKYFIGYKDAKIRPLFLFLSKMSTYRRDFDETKYMSFVIKYDELFELLEKCNGIWEKVKNDIKKEFDGKPM